MAKHRKFNADRFLDTLQGHEGLLRSYVGMWDGHFDLDAAALDVAAFKEFLVKGDDDGKDGLVEDLHRVYDLCTERGHQDLIDACAECGGYEPDPEGELPVECLSLKIRTEHDEAFDSAYARNTLWQAERFVLFRGREARSIDDAAAAAGRFQQTLADVFKGSKKSDRVLVRQYCEDACTNFIVYHEKRMKADLTFKWGKTVRKVTPTVYRPAQQDFISYNHETGQVEIETRTEKEEIALRTCFAECCLGDPAFFEGADAAKRLNLARIAEDDFKMHVEQGHTAALTEIHFALKQRHGPSLIVRSKNVLETLELNHLRRRIAPGTIRRAVLKIVFPDDQRGKRIELAGTNSVKFKRATHAEEVCAYLTAWELLLE